jgi:hypothetical protein
VAEDLLGYLLGHTGFSNAKLQHVDLIILGCEVGVDHRRVPVLAGSEISGGAVCLDLLHVFRYILLC